MLDINLLRNDPEKVKENIRKKFQDQKLVLVDEVVALDKEYRESRQQADTLRNQRKTLSKQIGGLMAQGKKDEAEATKAQVAAPWRTSWPRLEEKEEQLHERNQEAHDGHPQHHRPQRCPSARTTARMWSWSASASRRCRISRCPIMWTSWSAWTALIWTRPARPPATASIISMGDVARLHSAILSYARDFMIDRGFTYVCPPS